MQTFVPANAYKIAAFVILLVLLIVSPSTLRADETNNDTDNYIRGDGDGIIEPGENEEAELARAAQNPIASMISLPFQNNTNLNFGPKDKTQNVLNIQPVWPFELNENWNLITRTIIPVISQPETGPRTEREFGLGDTTFSAWLSPKDSGKWIWGVGPVFLVPTNTNDYLGADAWGAGPTAVFLTMPGRWVIGSLFSNVWDVGGSGDDVNLFTWQYFINYNLDHGWYLVTSPIINSNWEAESSSDEWTVPFGGGIGKIMRIGKLPVNVQAQAFYNSIRPSKAADWTIRFQMQFMFPKRK